MSISRLLQPKTRGDTIGLNGPWYHESDRIAPFVQQLKTLGVGGARISADWTFIQGSQPGVYNVDQFAPMFDALNKANIWIEAVVGYTPSFVMEPSSGGIPDINKLPLAMTEYENACYALGHRYPYLNIIELWSNEANCTYAYDQVNNTIAYCLAAAGSKGFKRAKKEQNQPAICTTAGLGACATATDALGKPKAGGGRWMWEYMGEMYQLHQFFCGLAGTDANTTPTPWDVVNIHAYMTWGDIKDPKTGKFTVNHVPGNALTYAADTLIADQKFRQWVGQKDVHWPNIWNSEAGWPTVWGAFPQQDMPFIARKGGWNGLGTPSSSQVEAGAAAMAQDHLDYWFSQQDKNLVGPFNIFIYDGAPPNNWSYGLYTNILGGRAKKTADVVKANAAKPFTAPQGWMAGLGVVPK